MSTSQFMLLALYSWLHHCFFFNLLCVKLYATELLVLHSVLIWVNFAESEETIEEYFSSSLPAMLVWPIANRSVRVCSQPKGSGRNQAEVVSCEPGITHPAWVQINAKEYRTINFFSLFAFILFFKCWMLNFPLHSTKNIFHPLMCTTPHQLYL